MLPVIGSMFRETIEYTSPVPAMELKKNIEALFYKTRGFRFSPNLGGQFVSDNEFLAYPKIELGTGRLFPGTRIKGVVAPGNAVTSIRLTMLPNYNYVVLFVLAVVMGAAFTIQSFADHFQKSSDNIGPILLLLVPLAILEVAYFTRLFLKRAFVNALDLSDVQE